MTAMFHPLLLSLLLTIAGLQQKPAEPPAQPQDDFPPVVERGQKQFTFLPGGKLTVTLGVPGSCRITGWQRSTILLEIERIVYHMPPDQAQALLVQFPVRTRYTPTTATFGTQGPPQALSSLEVNLTIYVPKTKTDVAINMTKGNLAIGAINGWVDASLLEGSIEAKSMSGYFSGITQLGDVRAEMTGNLWLGHSFTAVTKSGSVELRLPADYSTALQLETLSGNLTVDFPAQLVDGEETPLAVVTKKSGKSLVAKVGEGGPPIRLRTSVGDVTLARAVLP